MKINLDFYAFQIIFEYYNYFESLTRYHLSQLLHFRKFTTSNKNNFYVPLRRVSFFKINVKLCC